MRSLALAVCVLVAGCGGGGSSSSGSGAVAPVSTTTTTSPASWTVMLYMVGSNSLAISEVVNAKALEAVGSTADVNVVVELQTGAAAGTSGATQGANLAVFETPLDTSAKRYRVVKDPSFAANALVAKPLTMPTLTSPVSPKDTLGVVSMTSPDQLGQFVTWATSAYPAQKYALILCDHGGSWLGFGLDQVAGTFGDGAKLGASLQAAAAALGPGQRFDLLGFDGCLMSSLEVATLARPYASVLVGSETEQVANPTATSEGSTWSYARILQDLVATPSWSGRDLAASIVNRTGDRYEGDGGSAPEAVNPVYTISAIDLDRAAAVTSSWQAFTDAHVPLSTADFHAFGQACAATPTFFSLSQAGAPILVDLETFASRLGARISDPNLGAALAEAQGAVFASRHGPLVPELTGLSIFMPLGKNLTTSVAVEGTTEDYSTTAFAQATGWNALLTELFSGMDGLTTPPAVAITNVPATTLSPGATVSLDYAITGPDTSKVGGFVGLVQNGAITLVGELDQNKSGTTTGTFAWNGEVLALSDGQTTCFFDYHPTTPGSSVYYALVAVTPPGGASLPALMVLTVDAASMTGDIVGLYNIDGGVVASIQPALLVGAAVTPIFRVLDPTTLNVTLGTGTASVTVTSGSPLNLSVATATASSGQYVLGLAAKDFAGNIGLATTSVTVP